MHARPWLATSRGRESFESARSLVARVLLRRVMRTERGCAHPNAIDQLVFAPMICLVSFGSSRVGATLSSCSCATPIDRDCIDANALRVVTTADSSSDSISRTAPSAIAIFPFALRAATRRWRDSKRATSSTHGSSARCAKQACRVNGVYSRVGSSSYSWSRRLRPRSRCLASLRFRRASRCNC